MDIGSIAGACYIRTRKRLAAVTGCLDARTMPDLPPLPKWACSISSRLPPRAPASQAGYQLSTTFHIDYSDNIIDLWQAVSKDLL